MRKFAAITALAVAMVTGCNTAQPATHAGHKSLKAFSVRYQNGEDNYVCAHNLSEVKSWHNDNIVRAWRDTNSADDRACNDPNFVD